MVLGICLLLGGTRQRRIQDVEKTMKHHIAHSLVPLNLRIPTDLNNVLLDKSTKTYHGKTWLLTRNAFPLWERFDF